MLVSCSASMTWIRPGSEIVAPSADGRSSNVSSAPSCCPSWGVPGGAPPLGPSRGCCPTVSKSSESCRPSPPSEPARIGRPLPQPGRSLRPDPRRGDRAAGRDLAQRLDLLDRALAGHRGQPLDQGPELVFAEEANDRLAVVVGEAGGLEIERHGQLSDDRRELAAAVHRLAVLLELVAELLGLDLVDVGVEVVEVDPLRDQLRRRLLADPRHARDVVGRVALEGLVIDHLVRPQPVPLPDPRRVVDDRVLDARSGRHQPRLVGDELEHVEVDRDDRRLERDLLRVEGQLADDVVGLEALQLVDRDAQRLDDLADLRELRGQVVRHPRARRLVLGVLLVPERRPGEVEGDRDVVGLQVRETAQDDAAEAEDAVDQLTLGGRERRKGVVAAVHEPEAVEQHQAFHLGSSVSRRGSRSVGRGGRERAGELPCRRSPARSAEAARRDPEAEHREPDEQQPDRTEHHEASASWTTTWCWRAPPLRSVCRRHGARRRRDSRPRRPRCPSRSRPRSSRCMRHPSRSAGPGAPAAPAVGPAAPGAISGASLAYDCRHRLSTRRRLPLSAGADAAPPRRPGTNVATRSPATPTEVNAAAIGRVAERAEANGRRSERSQLPRWRRSACSAREAEVTRGARGSRECPGGGRDGDEVAMELGAGAAGREEVGGSCGVEVREVTGGVAGDQGDVVPSVLGGGGKVHVEGLTTSLAGSVPSWRCLGSRRAPNGRVTAAPRARDQQGGAERDERNRAGEELEPPFRHRAAVSSGDFDSPSSRVRCVGPVRRSVDGGASGRP